MDTKARLSRGFYNSLFSRIFSGVIIGAAVTAAYAQTPAPAVQPAVPAAGAATPTPQAPGKPPLTTQSAVTPVEQIRLGDRNVTLNIRTLAEVKRLQEEKDLRDKLQKALQGGGAANIPTTRAPVAIAPAASAAPRPLAPVAAAAPAKPKAGPTLVAVFGPPDAMLAEVQTGPRSTMTVKAGDALGSYKVEKISQTGLTLLTGNGNRQTVSVGQQAPQ